jgi:hypothetical protein
MIAATIEYVCDWVSGDDEQGYIKVMTPTGIIKGTWSSTGGMGDGAELISNSTQEFDDDEAYNFLNAAELCQGDGVYTADIDPDEHTLANIVWVSGPPGGGGNAPTHPHSHSHSPP